VPDGLQDHKLNGDLAGNSSENVRVVRQVDTSLQNVAQQTLWRKKIDFLMKYRSRILAPFINNYIFPLLSNCETLDNL
jgi:hypothetical protein